MIFLECFLWNIFVCVGVFFLFFSGRIFFWNVFFLGCFFLECFFFLSFGKGFPCVIFFCELSGRSLFADPRDPCGIPG